MSTLPDPQNPQEGDLRVWHMPQVGTPAGTFYVPVASPEEAARLMAVLANYDIWQFENLVKGDYCNASGLEVFEAGEWVEWYSADDEDIDEYATSLKLPAYHLWRKVTA